MIRIVLLNIVILLSFLSPVWAMTNAEGMRYLTVSALMQYGQRLYDRGQYDEASAVFNHVLQFNNHQFQALRYLKEMGRSPSDEVIVSNVDIKDTDSLKAAIAAKQRIIARLRGQISRIKADIAAAPDPKS